MGSTPVFVSKPDVSNEILKEVLTYLSLRDLASASMLSRAWQVLVFPHLYRTVYLAFADHLKHIARRVTSDGGTSLLSISANLKELVLCNASPKPGRAVITQGTLEYLKIIVPRLARLRSLTWNLPFLPDDVGIMPLFQTLCPDLGAFRVVFSQDYSFCRSVSYPLLFNFKNLTEIFIVSLGPSVIFEGEDFLPPLTYMLTSSPNLVTLVLDLSKNRSAFSPNRLISSLGDKFTFPRLRVLQLRGLVNPDWPAFAADSKSKSHPLRAFLDRHPTIEDLVLGWAPYGGEYFEIDANDIVSLLPSIKLFNGPAFPCGAIVKSSLSQQIESLVIGDKILHYDEDDVFVDTMTNVASGVTTLPKLRRLRILATTVMQAWVLGKFSRAASELEELEFDMGVDNYLEVHEIVGRAKNLSMLTVSSSFLYATEDFMDEELQDGPEDFIESLARENPRLKMVYCSEAEGYLGFRGWEIVRDDEEVKA